MGKTIFSLLLDVDEELLLIFLGLMLYCFNYLSDFKSIVISIIITSFVLLIFDLLLKDIFLLNAKNDYCKFVINNMISIVIIDYLIYFINGTSKNKTFYTYLNLAFACIFYETIVFKLYNYNNLCNDRLRVISKTIMRLATIHVFSNFLDKKPYDEEWFTFSYSQLFNFSLFNSIFYD